MTLLSHRQDSPALTAARCARRHPLCAQGLLRPGDAQSARGDAGRAVEYGKGNLIVRGRSRLPKSVVQGGGFWQAVYSMTSFERDVTCQPSGISLERLLPSTATPRMLGSLTLATCRCRAATEIYLLTYLRLLPLRLEEPLESVPMRFVTSTCYIVSTRRPVPHVCIV